ncbi:MAG: hypothetical protein BWK80_04575 [Desulfobacteraceae bacterium IS3]|nr:MAG: hypothetical protein BWK80_04575 [Desulfobacteraceae bacterium IS3]
MSKKKDIMNVMKSGDMPSIYFNEFGVGISKNDVFILLRRNGKEEAILNASHVTAKSLANALNEAINDFEVRTKQKILISEEIKETTETVGDADK